MRNRTHGKQKANPSGRSERKGGRLPHRSRRWLPGVAWRIVAGQIGGEVVRLMERPAVAPGVALSWLPCRSPASRNAGRCAACRQIGNSYGNLRNRPFAIWPFKITILPFPFFLKKRKGNGKVENFLPLILLGFVRFALSKSGNHTEMRGYRLKAPRWARRTT